MVDLHLYRLLCRIYNTQTTQYSLLAGCYNSISFQGKVTLLNPLPCQGVQSEY